MVALSMLGAALTLGAVAITPMPARSADGQAITLYTDPASGQVFTKRCKRCVKLGQYIPAGSTEEIEQKVERRVTQQTQAQLDQERAAMQADEAAKQAQQQQWNAEMAKQVSEIQPFAREFGDRWFKKISIGTTVFAYYGFWSHTGFGPQFMDANQQWPGPGNSSFNEFAINRTYIDLKFTPVDDVSMRVTPDMYAMVNTGTKCAATSTSTSTSTKPVTTKTTTKTACTASSGDASGVNTGWAQSADGNLGLRLKYTYLDYNTFFQKVAKIDAMRDDKFTFGQQPNPLVDWEENLWGFRYTALTPWNYTSLSSAQVGASMKGPIKVNETQYADYDLGVYDDASFHALEQSASKQVMGRVTINPFGAKSRYDSFGLTGFYDFGYSNKCTPDDNSIRGNNTTCGHFARAAALAHYTAATWGLIGEWDYGHNAFSSSNLFSGSGPSDAIGITSPTSGTLGKPYYDPGYAPWYKMVGNILNTQAVQMGWDFMGHYDIPHTPFTAFGLFQQFLPNTRVAHNPLDFERYDLGVQWLINKYLRVGLDAQAIQYYQKQFTYPEVMAKGQTTQAAVLDAVPRDTHAFFLHLEFKY
jgi:cell division septation protein DedD